MPYPHRLGGSQNHGEGDTCLVNKNDTVRRCENTTVSYVCDQRISTIVGTRGDDVIQDTPPSDVIVTLGGNDVVTTTGGYDRVCLGPGNDRLTAGNGWIRAFGGPGADIMRASSASGGAYLVGGPGNDLLDTVDRDPVTGALVTPGWGDSVDGVGGTDRCLVNSNDGWRNCEQVIVRGP